MLNFEGGRCEEVVGSPRKQVYVLVFEGGGGRGGRGGGVGKEKPSHPRK